MATHAKAAWQVLAVAIWINVSESVRWVLYSKPKFDALYRTMGLEMPNRLSNGILWMVWGLIVAVLVFLLARKFSLVQTALIVWTGALVTFWIALWNFSFLPPAILPVVVPLSLIEMFVAAWIAKRLQGREAE